MHRIRLEKIEVQKKIQNIDILTNKIDSEINYCTNVFIRSTLLSNKSKLFEMRKELYDEFYSKSEI